jgi:hypothetical protein
MLIVANHEQFNDVEARLGLRDPLNFRPLYFVQGTESILL